MSLALYSGLGNVDLTNVCVMMMCALERLIGATVVLGCVAISQTASTSRAVCIVQWSTVVSGGRQVVITEDWVRLRAEWR